MKKKIAHFILRLIGWKIQVDVPEIPKKAVIIGAPHVGWQDGFAAFFGGIILDLDYRVMIKRELMKPPLGWILNRLGALPVDRYSKDAAEQRRLLVENLKIEIEKNEEFVLVLAPEGTRRKVTHWKKGFYHIAIGTGIPIVCCYMDHVNKIGGVGKVIYPTGDINVDMKTIMAFYNTIPLKNPERFSLDVRYWKEEKEEKEENKIIIITLLMIIFTMIRMH